MQVCTSLQSDNHASTSPLVFCRPDALHATQPPASKHWMLHRIESYEGCSINKLQNSVFWLIFTISKRKFLYSGRNFCNNDIIIMMSLQLKAQSSCEIFSAATATLLGLGVMSKNEQVKQTQVNVYLFKTSNVNSFGIVDSFFNISKFI